MQGNFHLTKHFRLEEFKTTTLIKDYNPVIPDKGIARLTLLAVALEKLRNVVNSPIIITQGWRTQLLEEVMKKHGYKPSPTSQHKVGEAADIFVLDWPLMKTHKVLEELWHKYPGLYCQIRTYPKMGIHHVSIVPPDGRYIKRYCKVIDK